MDAVDLPQPPEAGSAAPEHRIVLLHEDSGTSYEATGSQFRLGRGRECEMRPVSPGDTSISRVHAQIEINADGSVLVRDAGSRNGTLVNGNRIDDESPFAVGDRLALGPAGPVLYFAELDGVTAPKPSSPATPRPVAPSSERALEPKPALRSPRRSFGGKGATVFFKDMFDESSRKSKSRLRWLVWTFVVLLAGSVGGVYWISELKVRRTEVQLEEQARLIEAQQARGDSLMLSANADVERLREELARARDGAAPADVLDSLRQALADAGARTDALEEALVTAQQSLNRELAMGDSLRNQAQADLARVRAELGRAQGGDQTSSSMDSLIEAVRAAQERADAIEAQMRAIRGVDLASISQTSQGAIGLVTVFSPSGIYDGSGFMITASGYFITNRHVVMPDGASADSVFITMADQSQPQSAVIANVADRYGPDLAILLVFDYNGPHLRHIDWTGTRMRQGEPAALIGFPAGMVAAMDANLTGTVRTSMSAGIFSKVETERVQFDGFTVSGSSGSPIFNASGEVVAVHRSGLRQAAGLGFGVPINKLLPLLPDQVKEELGIR
jgi:S1-C subfamily serine protease